MPKCLSCASPVARRVAATVLRAGVRMAPAIKTGTWAKTRAENSGAKAARVAIISSGRVGMGTSLGGSVLVLTLSASQTKMAKV